MSGLSCSAFGGEKIRLTVYAYTGSVKKQGIVIDKRKIKDNEPLKELGTYDIRVELYKDVIGKIKVKLIEE